MSSLAVRWLEQLDHVDRLRVVADHALHELDVGLAEPRLRQRGGAVRREDRALLTGCSRLDDRGRRSGRRGAATGSGDESDEHDDALQRRDFHE